MTPDAPPPLPANGSNKASGGMRVLALVGALALFFGAAVMYVVVANPDDTPRCEELEEQGALFGECFDVTETQETVSKIVAAPAGVLAALAGLVGLAVVATGRWGGLMLRLAVAAVTLGALAFLVNRL